MTENAWADAGWLVGVKLDGDGFKEERLFAVGYENAKQAEQAVVDFPGLCSADECRTLRPLALQEIRGLQLQRGGIRPFGFSAR